MDKIQVVRGEFKRIWMGFDATLEYMMKLLISDKISDFSVLHRDFATNE